MRTALIGFALLVPTLALADGFDSGGRPVLGGSGTAADGTAFVTESVPGTAASATTTDGIAVGDAAVSSAADAIAIGPNADATGENSIAIGGDGTDASSADAGGAQAVAIGFNTLSNTTGGVAIGSDAEAVGTGSVAIGDTAVGGDAAGDAAVIAIGSNAVATGTNSVAIGLNTDSTGVQSIAIGGHVTDATSADATGENAIAIGRDTLGSGIDGVAIGNESQATGSEDIAIGSTASATGTQSIAMGLLASASGDASIALSRSSIASADSATGIGYNVDATGANCVAIGGNATDTDSADCSAADSVAIGQHVIADDIGEFAFASGEFAAQSDAHTSIFVLRNNTTDATQTELFADGTAGDISVPSDCTLVFDALITARGTAADNVSAGYSFKGVIDNNAGTTALVGSLSAVETIGEDVAGWDVTATADDTNDGINILVTGAAATAVQWVARVEVVETCG